MGVMAVHRVEISLLAFQVEKVAQHAVIIRVFRLVENADIERALGSRGVKAAGGY